MLARYHDGVWRRIGGSGPGSPVPTEGIYHGVYTLPHSEHDELQGCHRQKIDPNHRHIHPYLHPGELNGLEGDPDTLPVPRSHSGRGPQLQHRPIP